MQSATCSEELDASAVLLTSVALQEGQFERLPEHCSKLPLLTLLLNAIIRAVVLLEFGAESVC